MRRVTRRASVISLHLRADGRRARTLALTYTNGGANNLSLLISARLTAHGDGQPDVVKNPLTFGYQQFDPQRFNVGWITSGQGDPAPPLTDREAALVALDDLPLPGVLVNRNGRQFYWPNDGRGGWGFPRPLSDTPFVGSFRADGVQFIDMDGTGSADMLVGIGSNPLNGYYENEWILNGLGHLIFWSLFNTRGWGSEFFRITDFKMDWSTGMLATKGGWVSNLNPIDTAYNMGFFASVDNDSSGWHLDREAGHNLAVYGSKQLTS